MDTLKNIFNGKKNPKTPKAKVEKDNKDLIKLKKLLENNMGYLHKFSKFRFEEKIPFEQITELFNKLQNIKLDKNINEFKTFESVLDYIELIERGHRVNAFIQLLPLHLKKDFRENKKLYSKLESILLSLNDEILKSEGFHTPYKLEDGKIKHGKISRYKSKTSQHLLDDLIIMTENVLSKTDLLKKIKLYNTELIHNENSYIIARIKDFKASENLGSRSWCISTGKGQWDNYLSGGNVQYFIWDFNRRPTDNYHMIGTTISKDGVRACHLKNDQGIQLKDYLKVCNMDENTINKIFNIKNRLESIIDFDLVEPFKERVKEPEYLNHFTQALGIGSYKICKFILDNTNDLKKIDNLLIHQLIQTQTSVESHNEWKKTELIQTLINKNIDINKKDSVGDTPLLKAITFKNIEIVITLLLNKANLSIKNNAGYSPIMKSISLNSEYKRKDDECVRILEELIKTNDPAIKLTNDDIGIINKDKCYIEYVFLNNIKNKNIVNYCLDNKINLNFKINDDYKSPILISVLDEYEYDLFKKLVEMGANINIKNDNNVYPLLNILESLADTCESEIQKNNITTVMAGILKAENKIFDILEFMVNHKSDVNSVDATFKIKPLEFAKKFQLKRIEKLLIDNGAK